MEDLAYGREGPKPTPAGLYALSSEDFDNHLRFLDGNPGNHTPWGSQLSLKATRELKGSVWKSVEVG